MNPVVVLLANGDAFFVGMGMAILSLLTRIWMRSALALMGMRIIGVLGVLLVIASSTPFPIWVYAVWLIIWAVAFARPFKQTRKAIIPCCTLFAILLCAWELPYHVLPTITFDKNRHVYVLGDSLSAGMGTSETNWPVILGDISQLEVTNLAQPGATASSALTQANGIAIPDSLVIIEIGGNDLLGSTPSDRFYVNLDALLKKVSAGNRCVMFELPLLPFSNAFGQAQRTLAAKYGVVLIPKKCLASVIAKSDNTLDGLHLSQKGHNRLAANLFSMFKMQMRY